MVLKFLFDSAFKIAVLGIAGVPPPKPLSLTLCLFPKIKKSTFMDDFIELYAKYEVRRKCWFYHSQHLVTFSLNVGGGWGGGGPSNSQYSN